MLAAFFALAAALAFPPLSSPPGQAMCCVSGPDCEARALTVLSGREHPFVFVLETETEALREWNGSPVARRVSSECQWPDHHLAVCTLNVWHFTGDYRTRLARLAVLLQSQECHVVLLQEMRTEWTFFGARHIISDLVAMMPQKSLSFDYRPAMAYIQRSSFEMEGLAILSYLPLLKVEAFPLSRNMTDEEDQHQRLLLRATVQVSSQGQTVDFFNTHMSLSSSARARNALEISALMREKRVDGVPQILAGDLNAEPDDFLYKHLTEELTDIGNCGLTFQSWNATKRIDYVLARDLSDLKVVSANTFGSVASEQDAPSDHVGLRVLLSATASVQKEEL